MQIIASAVVPKNLTPAVGRKGAVYPSSEVGLYIMVVRNWILLDAGAVQGILLILTFRLYLVVPLVASTPFLILLVAR